MRGKAAWLPRREAGQFVITAWVGGFKVFSSHFFFFIYELEKSNYRTYSRFIIAADRFE